MVAVAAQFFALLVSRLERLGLHSNKLQVSLLMPARDIRERLSAAPQLPSTINLYNKPLGKFRKSITNCKLQQNDLKNGEELKTKRRMECNCGDDYLCQTKLKRQKKLISKIK